MGILGPIIEAFSGFLSMVVTDLCHGSFIGGQAVGNDSPWLAVTFHGLFEKAKSGSFVSGFRNIGLQDLAFMIDGPPEIKLFPVDPHEDFIDMPSPQ